MRLEVLGAGMDTDMAYAVRASWKRLLVQTTIAIATCVAIICTLFELQDAHACEANSLVALLIDCDRP
jgi:hypothetical protein